MKATKALKRLTKIEASMSDVVEKYVSLAPAVRKALQDTMAAVVIAKEALNLEVFSSAVKIPAEQPERTSRTMPGTPKAKRKMNGGIPAQTPVLQKAPNKTGAPVGKARKTTAKKTAPAATSAASVTGGR
jgi:hypothetical protein